MEERNKNVLPTITLLHDDYYVQKERQQQKATIRNKKRK